MKTFCPNCEKDTECIHAAELYECQECGDDFAKYIVPRTAPCTAVNEPSNSDVSMTQDVLTDIKTPRSIENTNPDYYKAAEKTALVRLCGVLGVLTENNDLATAALLASTRIESLEKKIPALNVDLAEASMHAYNGEVARMKLEAENAELKADLKNKNTRIAELEAEIDQLTAHDAAERQDDKWIPISENPTKSDWYLIMYQGYRVPDADYYDVEAGWLSDIPIPDYWMPLPELPEEVK